MGAGRSRLWSGSDRLLGRQRAGRCGSICPDCGPRTQFTSFPALRLTRGFVRHTPGTCQSPDARWVAFGSSGLGGIGGSASQKVDSLRHERAWKRHCIFRLWPIGSPWVAAGMNSAGTKSSRVFDFCFYVVETSGLLSPLLRCHRSLPGGVRRSAWFRQSGWTFYCVRLRICIASGALRLSDIIGVGPLEGDSARFWLKI